MISTRSKLIVALVVVVCVISLLIRTAVTHASTYYVTVNEFFQQSVAEQERQTTISGEIIGSSVQWNPTTRMLQFDVEDTTGGRKLPVVYYGDKPDDFTNNWPVVVTGNRQANGHFVASKLLVKCPSKYEAANQTERANHY